jgi:TolA-binding protein
MVVTMKSLSHFFAGALLIAGLPATAFAQVSYGAQQYAEQQQAEERWRKLSSQVEEMERTQEVLRKRIATLEEENGSLRTDLNKNSNAGVSPEEFQRVIKQITDKLKELDEKRIADNKAIVEQVKQSIRDFKPAPATTTPHRPTSVPNESDPLPGAQEGFTHVLLEGQTISGVVQAFRAKGVKTSIKAVMDANPKIRDPKNVRAGTEIFVPSLK